MVSEGRYFGWVGLDLLSLIVSEGRYFGWVGLGFLDAPRLLLREERHGGDLSAHRTVSRAMENTSMNRFIQSAGP